MMTSMQTDAMTHIVIEKYPLRSRETSHQTGSADHARQHRRDRDRRERADALVGEQHDEIRAEPDEGLLADRDQARISGQQVPHAGHDQQLEEIDEQVGGAREDQVRQVARVPRR